MMKSVPDKLHVHGNEQRLRLYAAGLFVANAVYLSMHGSVGILLLFLAVTILIAAGLWQPQGPLLTAGVFLGLALAILHPAVFTAIESQGSLAKTLEGTTLWPQMLVAIFSSRIFAVRRELSFQRFWQEPLADTQNVGIQSLLAALSLGALLTMLHYAVLPGFTSDDAGETQSVMMGALLGETIIHTLILFLFFFVLAFIAEAAWHYRSDRLLLRRFRRSLSESPDRSLNTMEGLLSGTFVTLGHRRAVRLLNGAIELERGGAENGQHLPTRSFGAFHTASRHFIRSLLPFLTLLGFLGTVIGLATAVAELPGSLTAQPGGVDVSASLAGLAVKFETTFLGLVATMLATLLLNLLEKHEQELAAECLLIVHNANAADA